MTILRLFGVRVILNGYFLILLSLLALVGMLVEAGIAFSVVFLHELAHVVVARWSGLVVTEVELLPFGGVARIEDLLEVDPAIEAKVALGGPLANVVLIGVALVTSRLDWISPENEALFVQANAIIGGFNLVPALPLDGGRVYRALMAQRIGFRKATDVAVRVGKACAVMMAAVGALFLYLGFASVSLVVVGIFVYMTAGKERNQATYVLMRYLARRRGQLRMGGWMQLHQVVARQEAPIKELLGHLVPQRYHIVWVIDPQGRLVGIAQEIDVIDALFQRGIETPMGALVAPFWKG